MKKVIVLGMLLVVAVGGGGLWAATRFTTSCWELRERLDEKLYAAGWKILEVRGVVIDRRDLDFGLRVRMIVHPLPVDPIRGLTMNTVQYLLKPGQDHQRLKCYVHCVGNRVAHIVIEYPPSERQSAIDLAGVVRHALPKDAVRLREVSTAPSS